MPLLNTVKAAEYLAMNPKVLRIKASEGKVPCVRMGGRWKFSEEVLQDWIAQGCPDRTVQPSLWDQEDLG